MVASSKPRSQQAPTREDVRAAYNLILGREPEDQGVVDRHLAQSPTLSLLRRRFLDSEEFRGRDDSPKVKPLSIAPKPAEVEVAVSPSVLAAMLERVGSYWTSIGAEAPHWSVLTQDRFRPEHIATSRKIFYATGSEDADIVAGLLARQGIDPADLPYCVEFGCGVGRATLALAPMFQRMVGCDISAPHLDLAAAEAASRHLDRIEWHHSTIAAPMPDPGRPWNFWYSRIVLQHNPPPVIAHLLGLAFRGLAPGGLAIFQVPTHYQAYRFSAAEYLADQRGPRMEMHMIPQRQVFALAAEAGLQVLEVREDTHMVTASTANSLSNLFVLQRPA